VKQPVAPISVTELFPEVRAELLRVLRSLSDEQWAAPSLCPGWTVRNVVQHLLADDVGYLSGHRDHDGVWFEVTDWHDLVDKINQQNDTWVSATKRISRRMLLSLLEFTGNQFFEYLATLDPAEMSGSIGWMLNMPVPLSMHLAREYTEWWIHHQHICEAVGIASLKERRYFLPVLSTFVHALPRTYEQIAAPDDTTIHLHITGEAHSDWYLIRERDVWSLYASTDQPATSVITMNDDTAWRLFTRGLSEAEMRQRITIEGDVSLGQIIYNTVAIIA
jgi:uncharacterized protein (TIGR03083 family)